MRRFIKLPIQVMSNRSALDGSGKQPQPYCGGCGAKVSPNALSNALSTLAELYPQHCIVSYDDSREIVFPNKSVWQSIDALRETVSDPWQMGRLAVNHALSDLYACGLKPHSVQALITIPFASPSIQARELMQILEGALMVLRKSDCILTGGHSMQGAELQIAFAVNGHSPAFPTNLLSKQGLCDGDRLLLTRPLGSGVLFAAHMQLVANGLNLENALSIMIQSNYHAAKSCLEHGVRCATDVTGFGLAVHMLEMLEPSQGAIININDLPCFDGVLSCLAQGVRSTSHETNRGFASGSLTGLDGAGLESELLFDPQTCGGMLVGVAPKNLEELSNALSSEGVASYDIGEVTNGRGFIDLCY